MRTYPRKPKGEKAEIVVLYADLRGFSSWSSGAKPRDVARLVQMCYGRVIQLTVDYHHNFHKLLGDGFLLVWETGEFSNYDASRCHPAGGGLCEALGAAFEIHKKYFYAKRRIAHPIPDGFGIGIAVGEAYRVEPFTSLKELNEEDYVGYPMNAGARLQSLAGAYGVVLDSMGSKICRLCDKELLGRGNRYLEYRLVKPSTLARSKANELKGLSKEDKSGFAYVTWPYAQAELWKVDGRP